LFSVVSVIALFFILDASGGPVATVSQLATYAAKPGILSWHGFVGPDANWQTAAEAMTWAVILGVAWSVVVAVSPWQASRYLMAKDEHTVIRAGCGAAASITALYVVIAFAGAAVNLSNPDIDPPESVLVWAAMNLMPTAAGVLMMTGIMAAALSSASTFLSLVGFSASNDIFKRHASDERVQLRITRYAMLGLGLVALVLAHLVPPDIFWITYFAATVFASSWGPVAFMSIWSSRITEPAAFWGIIAGFGSNIGVNVLELLGVFDLPVYLDPIFLGAITSFAVIWIVSRCSTVTEEEHRFRDRLHQTPESELDAARVTRSMVWPKLMVTGGVAMALGLIFFYARPYQKALEATGESAVGELILSIGYGLLLVGSGILAHWGIRKYYAARG
jgi:sodium/pantothenate symporter